MDNNGNFVPIYLVNGKYYLATYSKERSPDALQNVPPEQLEALEGEYKLEAGLLVRIRNAELNGVSANNLHEPASKLAYDLKELTTTKYPMLLKTFDSSKVCTLTYLAWVAVQSKIFNSIGCLVVSSLRS